MAKPTYPATLNSSDPLASGLLGWWLLAEGTGTTAHDSSTTADDGTIASDVSWTTGDGADPVLSFPGDSGSGQNFVALGSSSTYRPAQFTVAVRFRADSSITNTWQTLFGRGSVFVGFDWLLVYNGTELRLAFPGGNNATITASKDVWHTVIGTCSGGSGNNIYLDGTTGTPDAYGTVGTGTRNLRIGRGDGNESDGFGGLISWAIIWDRVLSSTERAEVFSTPFQPFQSSGVTTTFAATLGGATLGAAAAFSTPTAFATTLAGASLASVATFAAPSALATTLAGVTLSSTAVFAAPSALTATLGGASLVATGGAVPAGGAFAAALDGATLAATTGFATAATFAPMLAGASLVATAQFATAVGLATTLGGASLVAVAHAAPPGQVTATLAAQLDGATLMATARSRMTAGDLTFVTNFGNTIYPLLDYTVVTVYPVPDWTIETAYPER